MASEIAQNPGLAETGLAQDNERLGENQQLALANAVDCTLVIDIREGARKVMHAGFFIAYTSCSPVAATANHQLLAGHLRSRWAMTSRLEVIF